MTYSIVACDGEQLGVATASHWLAAGALVAWAQAGVGAVATQAFTEPAYGPRILARLRAGAGVAESLTAALADDDRAQLRQVAVVDAHGEAAHTTASPASPTPPPARVVVPSRPVTCSPPPRCHNACSTPLPAHRATWPHGWSTRSPRVRPPVGTRGGARPPRSGWCTPTVRLWLALCHLGAEQPDQADAVLERVPAVTALAHA